MEYLILILACYGITNIIVNGKIMEPVIKALQWLNAHALLTLLNCSMCTGFWVGVFVGSVEAFLGNESSYLAWLPFVSSGTSWLLDRVAIYIDTKINLMEDQLA